MLIDCFESLVTFVFICILFLVFMVISDWHHLPFYLKCAKLILSVESLAFFFPLFYANLCDCEAMCFIFCWFWLVECGMFAGK